MSETDATETGAKSGKMKGILGFVLSLVSIILGSWVIGALYVAGGYSTGVAAIGLLLPILAVILSVMGMSASKKAGEKRGLAIAGLIIGICALVWLAIVVAGLGAMSSMGGELLDAANEYQDALDAMPH